MPNTKTYTRSFAGGELSAEMYGRIDDAKYQSGAARLKNFIATPQGPAENRPGTQFVHAVKDSTKATRLIPFTYSTDQTMVIELGVGYFRFHTAGATLLSGTVAAYAGGTTYTLGDMALSSGTKYYCIATTTGNAPPNATYWYPMPTSEYEIPNDYAEADLFDIHYVQSGDVLTLVHPNYPPAELRRLGATKWTLTDISFVAEISAPTPTVTATPGFSLQVTDITHANPAVITAGPTRNQEFTVWDRLLGRTPSGAVSNTLAVGDGIYIKDLSATVGGVTTSKDGFYMIYNIPLDESSNPILNEMSVMDYAGNVLDSSAWTSHSGSTTIQYGGKIYDITNYYVITAIDENSRESKISAEASALNNLNVSGAYNTITWPIFADVWGVFADDSENTTTFTLDPGKSSSFTVGDSLTIDVPGFSMTGVGTTITSIPNDHQVVTAYSGTGDRQTLTLGDPVVVGTISETNAVEDAKRYRIYKRRNGLYGFIGETTGGVFVDDNIAPDLGITPPNYDTMFSGTGNYPGAVGYVEQRRVFAGTTNKPQSFWMSRPGTETDFSYSIPTKDSDRVAFTVAAREKATIRHVVEIGHALMLTSSAEVRVSPVNSDAITPTTTGCKAQSYVGASDVQPSLVNNQVIFCAARGGHVRELGYRLDADGFVTGDLSLRAAHLFDNLTIVDQCVQKAPRPIVWFVSSNGTLLGLTYIPEEQIGAWHWHETDGDFESVTAVSEGNEDRLYVVVKRTIGESTVRYIERMGSRLFTDPEDAFFVDCGLTYDSTPATTITGLDHLEGETVAILADGAVCPQQTVESGAITLTHAASVVQVGLPIAYADLKTLPVTMQIEGFGQGRTKNINRVALKVYRSGTILIGPDENNLVEYKYRSTEDYGDPPALKSEEIELTLPGTWQKTGQIVIRQPNPLPLTVVGITLEVSIGG